jgi:peptidoglycan/LPS O-acetylase OafA/YrhL
LKSDYRGILMQTEGRIYYLDLLRALAIMLVFTGHTVLSFGASALTGPLGFGGTGVDLFFLLSGWLIGSQLYKEHQKFGSIDIPRFWMRRWMRTMPAYFAVLLLTLAQLYITKDNVASPLPYFLFIQNYFTPLKYFSISWSLALEEQFYLVVAPLILVLSSLNKRFIELLVLVSILLSPSLFRELGWFNSLTETHVRWDCCIMGIILAFIKNRFSKCWGIFSNNATAMCVLAALLYITFFYFRWSPPIDNYSDPSKLVLSLVFAGLVVKAVSTPVAKLPFAHALIMHISTRSYSIYLLHADALALTKRLLDTNYILIYYVFALVLSLVMAEILYRIVEIPFINLRDRFSLSSKRQLA